MPGWLQFNPVPDSEVTLSEEDKLLLDKLAAKIVNMGMSVPAIFFIESTRPLSFIGSQAMVFFGPILELFFPGGTYYQFARILEDRKNLSYLLQLIEMKEDENRMVRLKERKDSKGKKRGILGLFKKREKYETTD